MSDAANLDEKKPVEELTFREALSELESIVSVLESNTLELEESLAAYERGVVLLARCRSAWAPPSSRWRCSWASWWPPPTTRPRTRPSPRTVAARQIP